MKNLQRIFMTLALMLGVVSLQAQGNDCDCPEPTEEDIVCVDLGGEILAFPSACLAECIGFEVVEGDCTIEDWDDQGDWEDEEWDNEMDFLAWDVNGETYNTFGNEPLLVEAPGSGVLDVLLLGGGYKATRILLCNLLLVSLVIAHFHGLNQVLSLRKNQSCALRITMETGSFTRQNLCVTRMLIS